MFTQERIRILTNQKRFQKPMDLFPLLVFNFESVVRFFILVFLVLKGTHFNVCGLVVDNYGF